jgi:GT2 family glycosyltransferase
MEWDTPIGPAIACGGDALIRVTAFEHVGGYNPLVIAGEEPEMCVRLRQAGWTIWRIDAEMTLHDAAITRLGQWWKRNVRSGHAYAEGNFLHGAPPEHFRRSEVKSIEKWVIFPIFFAAAGVGVIGAFAPKWCFFGILPILLYPAQAIRIARQRTARGIPAKDALLYGISVVLGKFPQWIGVCRFRSRLERGERSAIIEYKN